MSRPKTVSSLGFIDRLFVDLSDSEINAISGASAGVISALAVCPLDVAKTKLQAQGGMVSLQKQYKELDSEIHSKIMLQHSKLAPQIPSSSISSPNTLNKQNLFPSPPSPLSTSKLVNTPPVTSAPTPPSPKYKGLFRTLSTIVKEDGIPGLYRGVVPITIGYLPTWAIYFVVYEDMRKLTMKNYSQYPFISNMFSALTAGVFSTLLTNPIWVVKTRLMAQTAGSWYYKGTIDAFHKMYTQEGIMSFYAGLGPALLGLLHVAVQFPLYEKLKDLFNVDDSKPKLTQVPRILASSAISKICASTLTYPHEVIRTRIQIQPNFKDTHANSGPLDNPSSSRTFRRRFWPQSNHQNKSLMKYRGIIQTAKTIFAEEGWRAFYSGLGTNMIRTVPASALTLLSYEIIASAIRSHRQTILESI